MLRSLAGSIITVALLGSSGCTTVQLTRNIDTETRCKVSVLRVAPTDGTYDEVGSAHLSDGVWVSPSAAEESLREQACEQGADAVLILDESYGVPFSGTNVRAALLRVHKAPPVTSASDATSGTAASAL